MTKLVLRPRAIASTSNISCRRYRKSLTSRQL
jgi:hypothetical protein